MRKERGPSPVSDRPTFRFPPRPPATWPPPAGRAEESCASFPTSQSPLPRRQPLRASRPVGRPCSVRVLTPPHPHSQQPLLPAQGKALTEKGASRTLRTDADPSAVPHRSVTHRPPRAHEVSTRAAPTAAKSRPRPPAGHCGCADTHTDAALAPRLETGSGRDKILAAACRAISREGTWALYCVLLVSCSGRHGKSAMWSKEGGRGTERASETRDWSACSCAVTY